MIYKNKPLQDNLCKFISYSDPDYIQAFKRSSLTPRTPLKRGLLSNTIMPHTGTLEEAKRPTSRGSVSSMPPQLQHPQSGRRPSSAGKSDKSDSRKRNYDKTPEQKGLMLIINFSKDRGGSDDDVCKLRELFKSTFGFKVESGIDLTKDRLKRTLTEVINSNMSTEGIAKQYYCFICVVMGHGDEHGIITSDDQHVTMDEITSYFKNEQTPSFLGKPKIFIVQACQGSSTQPMVESDDCSEDTKDYVGKISVPHDTDILIAYATTHGNRAYRTINSDIGAWFIHVLLQIIEERYEEDHFEDMLVLVRNTLALKHEWRKGGYCQMACSWTTLTKRFYLK